ncbi:MAG: HD domain-containing phosphohydrolase [Planctomycetota bacterium]
MAGSKHNPALVGGAASTRRSRRRLIAIAVLAQAAVLLAGWAATVWLAQTRASASLERLILDQNVHTANVMADTIREIGPENIRRGSPDWRRLQGLVEQVDLLEQGYVCILDAQDRIVCHPELRQNPDLYLMSYADMTLADDHGREVSFAQLPDGIISTGRMQTMQGGFHLVATAEVPSINGRLNVHQPVDALALAGDRITLPMIWSGVATGSVVLIVTTLLISHLMRRHDRALEAINQGLEHEVKARVEKGLATRNALVRGLAKLAESRDTDTGSHLERIAQYASILADELRERHPVIDDRWIDDVAVASTMHDIGKVGIPDSVLLKPGRLTDEERAVIERHPLIGAETLQSVSRTMGEDDLIEKSHRIALCHHERWDGGGYPNQVRGDSIPLEARIIALVDVYDALTSERPYKKAMTHEKAVGIIVEGSGSHFDPDVVAAFVRRLDEFDRARSRMQDSEAMPVLPASRRVA